MSADEGCKRGLGKAEGAPGRRRFPCVRFPDDFGRPAVGRSAELGKRCAPTTLHESQSGLWQRCR